MKKRAILMCILFLASYSPGTVLAADKKVTTKSQVKPVEEEIPTGVVDMVIASVDGEPLTLQELKAYVSTAGDVPKTDLESGKFEVEKYLRDFITQRLMEKEAKASGLSVSEEDVNNYIDEIKKQNGVDDAGLSRLVQSKGLTLETYKQQITFDILRTRLVATRVRSKVNVSDEDVKRYLEDHPDRRPAVGAVHLHQVFYPSSAESAAKAREIHDKAKSAAQLKEAAGSAYSDLGFVDVADLRPELGEVVTKLKAGEISDVIDTSKGDYVLVVSEKQEGEQELSPELIEQIKRELLDLRVKEELTRFLAEELPKKYNVEMKL